VILEHFGNSSFDPPSGNESFAKLCTQLQLESIAAALRCQSEAMMFATCWGKSWMSFLGDLAKSVDHNDALEVTSDYVQNTIGEVAEEAATLAVIGSRFGSRMAEAMQGFAKDHSEKLAVRALS